MKKSNYMAFLQEARQFIPQERIYTDELRRLAWGTDAGFYRLIPQIVIRSEGEEEISRLLKLADLYNLPVTFRAAGTSLSGQAISDSILIVAGKHWEKYSISPDHKEITLQPGIIGQRVNELLAPFGRKFAPDPASVKSAMVGGIVMNNASGMNCGTHANSDKVLLSARIILPDGTLLDTGDSVSRAAFEVTHRDFIRRICTLRDEVRADEKLAERIRYKYSIKNVTGLNLLPFVRFDDPFDIITHLMVGSEGTLAFLSQVTMQTEYNYPFKASAMLYFKTIKDACRAVVAMKKLTDSNGEWIVKGALFGISLARSFVQTVHYTVWHTADQLGSRGGWLSRFEFRVRSSEISYADVRVSPIARLMKRWPVFVVAGSCRPELPLFVYRSGQEELFRELLPEFRMPPDTRHDLTHRSAVFFAPAGIPFGLCLLLVLVSRSVLPALTGTLLIPTAVFAVFLAGGLIGWLKEGIWLREGRFTLRRQKGVYLHCICVFHPDVCLRTFQSPWAARYQRMTLTLALPGQVRLKVRSIPVRDAAPCLNALEQEI